MNVLGMTLDSSPCSLTGGRAWLLWVTAAAGAHSSTCHTGSSQNTIKTIHLKSFWKTNLRFKHQAQSVPSSLFSQLAFAKASSCSRDNEGWRIQSRWHQLCKPSSQARGGSSSCGTAGAAPRDRSSGCSDTAPGNASVPHENQLKCSGLCLLTDGEILGMLGLHLPGGDPVEEQILTFVVLWGITTFTYHVWRSRKCTWLNFFVWKSWHAFFISEDWK